MKKYMILFLLFISYTPLLSASSIIWESEYGDYIWQWKNTTFDTNDWAKITVSNADANTVRFQLSSFSISWMNAEFSSENWKTLLQGWKFYPAKRNAFRDGYNWIDISWDGRGCNTILWGFYVHEYILDGSTLKSAAIDFVQYCEWSTDKWLYWSLRYNSNIASSCSNWVCKWVRTLLAPNTSNKTTANTTSTKATSSTLHKSDVEMKKKIQKLQDESIDLMDKLSDEFPLFFEKCDIQNFLNGSSIDENSCENEYKWILQKVKKSIFTKEIKISKLGKWKSGTNRINAMLKWYDSVIISLRKDRLKSKKLTPSQNIQSSSEIIYFEMTRLVWKIVWTLQ